MIRNITVGIDVGSMMTRVIVGEFLKGEKNPKIIGVGEAPTFGIQHGYVDQPVPLLSSIQNAVAQAEKSSGRKIKRALISIGGTSLRGEYSTGSVIVSKADGEVTSLDINKVLEDCEENLNLNNKKVVQSFPITYKLDGKEVAGRLEGMRGTKLEAKALFITYSIVHLEDLVTVLAEAGIETTEAISTPIATAKIVLSERQKMVGVAVVNIGAETTSLAVFENGLPISMHSFSIGSSNITNDIALGFKTTLENAELLKIGKVEENFSQKKLDEIIEARLSDIFESIDNHLKKIKRSELLPAGIVLTGGGANLENIDEIAKTILKLPVSIGGTEMFGTLKTKLRDPSWFTCLGLIMSEREETGYSDNSISNLFKDIKSSIKSSIKQLMP